MSDGAISLLAFVIVLVVIGLIASWRFQPMTPTHCALIMARNLTPAELKACQELLP
jgi:hypothetical protein